MSKLFLLAAIFAFAATISVRAQEAKPDKLIYTLNALIARIAESEAESRADSFNEKAVLSDDDKLYTCSILAEPPLRISPVKAENSVDSVPRLVSGTLGVSNGRVDCEVKFPKLRIDKADLHYKIDDLDFVYLMSVNVDGQGLCKLGLKNFKIEKTEPVNSKVKRLDFKEGAKTLADPITPKVLSSLNEKMIDKLRGYMIEKIEAIINNTPFSCVQ